MVLTADGRRVGAMRNGFAFVSMSDERRSAEFTLDFARALKLADALESGAPCQVQASQGRVLEYRFDDSTGAPLLGDSIAEPGGASEILGYRVRPQQQRGPWPLGVDECKQLADEIRQAISG